MTIKINNLNRQPVRNEVNARSRKRRTRERDLSELPPARMLANDVGAPVKLISLAVGDLRPADRKVRKIDPAQVARVRASVAEFGWIAPLLITGERVIIDGHTRHAVALEAGLGVVPCIVVDHLTAAQVRTLRIGINRIAEQGVWDFDALQIELAELVVIDTPLEVSGFSRPEIDALLLGEPEPDSDAERQVGEDVPVSDGPPLTRAGDVWRLGKHVIACGDARDAALIDDLMGGELARLVLTDPPYNVAIAGHVTSSGDHREFAMASGEMTDAEFSTFNREWMRASIEALADGGLLAPFIDWRSIETMIRTQRECGLILLNLIVWAKPNGGMGSLWRSRHELLPVAKKGSAPHVNNVELGRHGRWRSNLWEYAGASSFGSDAREGLKSHPTVKPVAMLEDALLDVTNRDDVVLDPFLGSGSTLIAAENTGRRCRGIELDPIYVDVILRRWMALTGKDAILEETGETFAETAACRPCAGSEEPEEVAL